MMKAQNERTPEMMLEIGYNGFRMNAEMLKYAWDNEIIVVRDIIDRIAERKKAAMK